MSARLVIALLALAGATGAAAELADPTRPVLPAATPVAQAAPVADAGRWILSLVKCAGEDRRALVNGRLLREGEHLDGARVVEIRDDSVVLEAAGTRHRLRLGSDQARAGIVIRNSRSTP